MIQRTNAAFVAGLIFLLPTAALAQAAHDAAAPPHWSYLGHDGPDRWGDLAENYRLCRTGRMQSPIDLGKPDVKARFTVAAAYHAAPLAVLNNGHTVQIELPAGSTLSGGDAQYRLVQIHFHTPSEEAVNGVRAPLVAHLVHSDAAGVLAVLGVLFEEGAANRELAKVIAAAPKHGGDRNQPQGVTFDPAGLLPSDLSVYRFEGSLTTPPCSEGVHWHVATHRMTASAQQIAALHAIMGDNARPIQPAYGRVVVAGGE